MEKILEQYMITDLSSIVMEYNCETEHKDNMIKELNNTIFVNLKKCKGIIKPIFYSRLWQTPKDQVTNELNYIFYKATVVEEIFKTIKRENRWMRKCYFRKCFLMKR